MATYEYNPTGSSTTAFIIGDDDETTIPDSYSGVILSTQKAFDKNVLDVVLPDMFNQLELDYSYNPFDNSITISSRKSNMTGSAESIVTELSSSSVDLSNVFTRDSNPTYFNEAEFYNHMYEVSAVVNSSATDTQKSNELQKILYHESNYDYKKGFLGKGDSDSSVFESTLIGFTIDKPKSSTVQNYGVQKGVYWHTSYLLDIGSYNIEQYINGSKYGYTHSDTLVSSSQYNQIYNSLFGHLRGVCNTRNQLGSFIIPITPPTPKPPDKRIPTNCCLLVEFYPLLYKYSEED